MYVQITTRCNMKCDHCCFSCEPGKGEDMSREVWEAVLTEAAGRYITIGGGEPTLHPDFERMLLEALAVAESVCIITNGKAKKRALMLAKLGKAGVVETQLSQDEYHEPIDPEVVEAFEAMGTYDYMGERKGIRNTTSDGRMPGAVGRALETVFEGYEEDELPEFSCMCETHQVKPNGDIHQCGCPDSPKIGDVFNGFQPMEDEYGDSEACYRRVQNQEMQPA